MRALSEAIRLFGSQAALGAATGYTQNAVYQAARRGRVTPRMALAIERASRRKGHPIKCEQLCPGLSRRQLEQFVEVSRRLERRSNNGNGR